MASNVNSSVYKISCTNPNRWYTRYVIEGGITLSLLATAIIFINCTTQVYGLAIQFSLGTFNHTGLEKIPKPFLMVSRRKEGRQIIPYHRRRPVLDYPNFRLVIQSKNYLLLYRIVPSQVGLI